MTYNKPKVTLLGDAARAIQATGTKDGTMQQDPIPPHHLNFNPAYDLDE